MKRTLVVLLGVAMLVVAIQSTASSSDDQGDVLRFNTMVGVPPAYTAAKSPIRGINGGGVPWVIDKGKGRLRADGRLDVEVEGLVLATTGANPAPTFKAIVSCQSVDAAGSATIANVLTDAAPATSDGNAEFHTSVPLPKPCIAPIVFVANGASGAWFASTGV